MNKIYIDKCIADKSEFIVCWYAYLKNWVNSENVSNQTQQQFLNWSGLSKTDIFTKEIKYKDSYIAPLEILQTMGVTATKVAYGKHSRYIYQFQRTLDNFFAVDKTYMEEIEKLGVNKFAFLLKLKAICVNNTNVCLLKKEEIANRLNISRPTLNKYLKELSEYITPIKGGFEIIHPAFNLEEDIFIAAMKRFSVLKGSKMVEPSKDSMLLLPFIKGRFKGEIRAFWDYLCKSFRNLPSLVSIEYYNTAITKERVHKRKSVEISEIKL